MWLTDANKDLSFRLSGAVCQCEEHNVPMEDNNESEEKLSEWLVGLPQVGERIQVNSRIYM